MYIIKMTEKFEKKFYKLIPKALQDQTWRRIHKLSDNPFLGKPLSNSFIRELKLEKFRIYFAIYKNEVIVLLLDISDKKEQQKVIDTIKENRQLLNEFIKNLN